MKKISMILSVLAVSGVVAGAGILASQTNPLTLSVLQADEPAARLVLNHSNAGVTEKSAYEHFSYSGNSASDTGFVKLSANGTFEKTEASKGLNKINVTFSGELKVRTWYSDAFEGDYFTYFLQSGADQDIVGDYFRLIAITEVDISEVKLWYDCENAAVRPTGTVDVSFNNNKTGGEHFGWLEKHNSQVYLTLTGTYTGPLQKSDIALYEIYGGQESSIDLEALSILDSTYFQARFNLSYMYGNNGNNPMFNVRRDALFGSFEWVGHLRIQGNDKGNLGSKMGEGATAKGLDTTSQNDGHVNYSLRTEDWDGVHTLVMTFAENYYESSPVALNEISFNPEHVGELQAIANVKNQFDYNSFADGNGDKVRFALTKYDDPSVVFSKTIDSATYIDGKFTFAIGDIGAAFNATVNQPTYQGVRFKLDLQFESSEGVFTTIDSDRESTTYDRENPTSNAANYWGIFADGTGYSLICKY